MVVNEKKDDCWVIESAEQLKRVHDNLEVLRADNWEIFQKALVIVEQNATVFINLLKSQDPIDKQAAIYATVSLVETTIGEEQEKLVELADALLDNIENPDTEIAKVASRAVIYLILNSKTFALQMLGNAFDKADRWCGQNEGLRRIEPWILYRDLALFTAVQFFERADNFFDHIFMAIRDPKIVVREHAAQALHAALAVTSQREAKQKNAWYEKCFKKACEQARGLPKDDALHTTLLLFNELLRIASVEAEQQRLKITDAPSSSSTGSLIGRNPILWLKDPGSPAVVESRTAHTLVTENYYAEIIERCMNARSSKSKHCQALLLEIFPRIVTINQIQDYQLNDFVEHALNLTAKYPQAFLSFGLLSLNQPRQLGPKVPKYFSILGQQLKECIQKKKPINDMLFKSLCLVVRSQKDKLYNEIQRMLPLLLMTGLSEGLTEVFEEIVHCIPSLKTDVLDGLMEQLYQLLMNRQLPSKLAPPTAPPVPSGPIQIANIELTQLALKTLGSFEFQRHALQMFMRYIALGYLVSNVVEIQLAAVHCCVSIVKPFIKVYDEVEDSAKKYEVYSLIRSVLDSLIKIAITDPKVEVRLSVLESFRNVDHDFLIHLAQQETLDSIFMILNDEKYKMQEAAAGLLAQLSELNPALILPKLRKLLNEKIYNLASSRVPKLEEHSARIIINLAVHAPKFISLFMKPLLMVLQPHLDNEMKNIDVTINVLNAVSELALIGGLDVVKITSKLIPILLNCLKDSTSLQRREAALRALGNLCQSSAYVVEPYKDHPELLNLFLKLLRTELSSSMHRLTMKVFGIIGALDPYMHKVYLGTVHSYASKSLALSLPQSINKYDYTKDGSDIIQWINFERCSLSEYYPTLAIINLVRMLHDNALSNLYQQIIEAILLIFKSLGTRSSQYVNQVIPQMIQITENCKQERREFFLRQFGVLASIIQHQLQPYIKSIFELIHKAWKWNSSANLRANAVFVMTEVGKAMELEFTPYIGDLCPYLLEIVENTNAKEKTSIVLIKNTLNCISAIVPCLSGHIHVILTPVLTILDSTRTEIDVRCEAVKTLHLIAQNHDVSDRAAAIMQTWLRCIQVKGLQEPLMLLLKDVMSQMWTQFLVYAERVKEAVEKSKVTGLLQEEYKHLLNQIHNNPQNPPSDNLLPTIGRRIPVCSNVFLNYASSSGGMPRQIAQRETTPSEIVTTMNVESLKTAWKAPGFTSRDDWIEWLINLRKQFLNYSPSPALNACAKLAFHYPPLATELFNAAFMSVWTKLNESEQDEVTAQFVDVITMCKTCPEPVQAILNLAEFMEHSEKGPLPVNYDMLMACAEATRAYAKALRYNELSILEKEVPNAEDCQTIIAYANKLNLEEASIGIVQFAEKHKMTISGRWYEKLGEWEKALDMYVSDVEETSSNGEDNDDSMLHQMRCLEALGRWNELNKLSESALDRGIFNPEDALFRWSDVDKRQKVAQMSARGYWAVGNYEKMANFVDKINVNNTDGSFLRAVLSIRNNQFLEATKYINRVRDMLDSELTSMAAESYERAYGAVIMAQQLTELEEAIEYKMIPERRTRIAILWSRRLQGCRKNIEHWQRILLVRSLVLSQAELRPMWVKFSSLCRHEGKMSMSRRVLCSLMDLPEDSPLENVSVPLEKPFLALAVCKQNWADGHRRNAYESVERLASAMHRLIRNSGSAAKSQLEPMMHLTAKCYMKLGDWYAHSGLPPATANVRTRNPSRHPHAQKPTFEQLSYMNQAEFNTLEQYTKGATVYYTNATTFDPNWYKAWHKLGTMYYNFVMTERQLMFGSVDTNLPSTPNMFDNNMAANFGDVADSSTYNSMSNPLASAKNSQFSTRPQYAVKAVQCFVKAIQLAEGSRVEDTLRLLMIWFDHCEKPEVFEQLRDLIVCDKTIPVETWLEVVPQIIGRMDSKQNVGLLVKQVVIDIAKAHPQAIVYALTAATKSKNAQRCKVAEEILRLVAEEKPSFVEQACLISNEFIRCAILWHEQWHGTLEEASRLYFQEKDFEGMMNALRPLHERIDAGHTTLKEESFNQNYYRELKDAFEHCQQYGLSGDQKQITQGWDLYYRVFKRISNQLRSMNALDLNYISPQLLKAQNLEISVPGTYDPSSPLITIASIVPHLEVITSKQRPRKMSIRGSDGNEYSFLLKGNEDPRQDERIMQLFGLINHLILREPDTNRRNLSIQRYSIIPLSQTSGLIGWIPNCDTLHSLIRDYREKARIPVSIEHTKMQQLVIDIEKLTLLQKVEIFDEVLKSTSGDDIKSTLWAHSPNSEVWFDRRTNYTRSIATSSMVGYILGLGDRHPSNLMLDRLSGKIVHIDFGDCFEVAMKRVKYPEKIPFRLTRMLVRAMEVTGIEGNYRLTCERVLRLLRNNHDSILAVLEAFVYDPVLNWRLTESSARRPNAERIGAEADEQQQLTGSHSDAIGRVKAKLTGRDFNLYEEMSVPEQVNRLIEQATLYDNLCQCYIGWCPFW